MKTRLVGFVLLLLVSFPILSMLSYDWHDVPWLNMNGAEGVNNLIGKAGAWGTFFGFSLFGFSLYALPVWMLLFGFLLILDRMRNPWRRFWWALLFQLGLAALLETCVSESACEAINIKSPGGCLGWFIMSKCLKPVLGSVGGVQVVAAAMLLAVVFGVGFANWRAFFSAIVEWVRNRRIAHASEEEREMLEELKRLRDAEKARKQEEKEAEREARRLEKEEKARIKEEEREARRQEREEKARQREEEQRAREEERLARQREIAAQEERIRQQREAEEAQRKAVAAAAAAARKAEEERRAAAAAAAQEAADTPESEEDEADDSGEEPDEETREEAAEVVEEKPYVLPTTELLSPVPNGEADAGNTEETAALIAATLTEFRVPGEITHVEQGPVITTYEFLPASKIKPEQVAAMDKTLEMRIMAKSLRIEAPIPGKGVCGIEVPNKVPRAVTVREILDGDVWATMSKKLKLPLLLGKDASGKDLVVDLADMPHLLVAGATGSGKSVCMNAMLTGLLMTRTPDELKLILVDPKVVEFTGYNAIPHLVVPVITDPKKVALGLIWAIHEMERRYRMLSAVGVKNISSFNSRQKPAVQQEFAGFGGNDDDAARKERAQEQYPDKLPYIVIVIDEMADLMLQVKKEIEDGITRLAQKSRAVGIHLILATQRPTVNIVTGTIKANIAGRIAFQVAQKNDSKTIIDRMGAESLIGRGDMLFLNPRTGKTVRAQGAFITDSDAEAVTEYIRSQAQPKYSAEAQEQLEAAGADSKQPEKGGRGSARGGSGARPSEFAPSSGDAGAGEDGDGDDALYDQAIAVIKRTRRASTSSLQRALGIGYGRAARILDMLEERGVVGPPRGAMPREILIDLDGEIPTNPDAADGADGTQDEATEE